MLGAGTREKENKEVFLLFF